MTIAIDYENNEPPVSNPGGSYEEDYGDVCSILVPIDLTQPGVLKQAMAGGTELPEDPSPHWSSGATYALGARVHLSSTHRVYESVKDSNTNRDPSYPVNQFSASGVATWWLEIGPTNRYAAFDGLINSQTSGASPLRFTLTPGAFSGVALFGVEADSYSLEVREYSGGPSFFVESNVPLEASQPEDYYEYFFDPFKPLTQLIRTGLDPYSGSEVTLTLYKGSGDAKLGMFAVGNLRPVGIPQREARVEPQDFSYFRQDAFGNSVVKKRPSATGMTIKTVMDKDDAGVVLDTVKEVLGVPVVVIGSQARKFEWMTVFGLISGSMTPGPYPYTTLDITVRGFN